MTRFTSSLLLSLPLACAAAPGAPPAEPDGPRACTEIGCNDGLELEFARQTPWPAGSYRVTLRVDGKSMACQGELPLRACDAGPSFQCDDPSLTLGESGCALPAEQHGLSGLHMAVSAATDVSLVIEHQGALQATAKLSPTFQTSQPNGPGCEPVCRNAAMRLNLR